ncbi:DinB family protein [Trinickia acidisoli]|uniref:DinB family protein n=1 Tax=Trinickia acidisoli TaxID=2767482 RepID=UPI001A8EEFAF|nr:DinB family protein [Trinickia acidisoli]
MARQPAFQPYSQLIAIKQWADRGLYDVVDQNLDRLSYEDRSIMLRIFDHMHVVDQIFQHHLQGVPHTFQAARSQQAPEFRALADRAREVDDWYVSYVNGLTQSDFEQPIDFTFTSGKQARMQRGEIILHVCLHGTYHRGNAGAVLLLKGITPSRDSITDFLEDTGSMPVSAASASASA